MLLLLAGILKAKTNEDRWAALEALMGKRAEFLIRHAISGLGLSVSEAKRLLSEPSLTSQEASIRRSLLAAISNLIDFAVAEEYQMASQLEDEEDDDYDVYEDEDSDENEEEFSHNIKLFKRYNQQYALVENQDVIYAMTVAATWSWFHEGSVLVYETQGDERVRPWHAQWEGYSAPKEEFPEWLIPPIEHGCRCFLVEDSVVSASLDVRADVAIPSMPEGFNPIFKESVSKGGRIFSEAHPYFTVETVDLDRLREIASRINENIQQWLT